MSGERIALFRPDDDRLRDGVTLLRSLGADPLPDPLLAIEPTDEVPRTDAEFVVLTSKTGAELLPADWEPGGATLCAIGGPTASAIEAAGHVVDIVPETFSSSGIVDALADHVAGAKVEVARSDHGSSALLDGLDEAGAFHHETVLYRLVRPPTAGDSTELAADAALDAALFTSSLTVEHFLAAAADRGVRKAAIAGLEEAIVGVIGEPTRSTAVGHGLAVDVVPDDATFEGLARAVVGRLRDS